ncbi:unnamed protein product [Calypogeia fissa]
MSKAVSFIESASNASHLGGVPRYLVLSTIGGLAKLVTTFLNRTRVYNKDTLLDLVQSRPAGTPLVTVSNHMSTIDDPLMWGLKGLPIEDPKLSRWTLAAEDICFTNHLFSYFFRLGKCLPVKRGAGIYQPHTNKALDVINGGDWLHAFPEGKLSQEDGPLRRLKWGVASLIARADVKPIVLPIAHSGFEKVFPENFWFGKRPPLPLLMKHISIVVGEPMVFDVAQLKIDARAMTAKTSCKSPVGNNHPTSTIMGSRIPSHPTAGIGYSTCLHVDPVQNTKVKQDLGVDSPLDEVALNWMHSHMSEKMRCVLQDLVLKAKSINKIHS